MPRAPSAPDDSAATLTLSGAAPAPIPTADTLRDPRSTSATIELAAAAPIPTTDDRYALRELIGKGGMGEVWLADDRQVGREVAVKVARAGVDSDGLARFLREARIQGQLDHPAVVPVHELGSHDGTTFFSMKRVRGETLAALCSKLADGDAEVRRRATPRRLLTAFVSACHAVELAHARGVLHRDLKPANFMLGDHGEVYVLDWGLAKPAGAADAPSSLPSLPPGLDGALTEAGQYLGTPGYMAPEQARGEPLDERADVFALGATLFELLTFRPLIPRGPASAVIAATLAGVDARASLRAADPIAPELEEVCIRATALRPVDRFRTVGAMREAIERYLDGDRDLERRRALAEDATGAARAVHGAALAGDARARAAALSELGQALVLDPGHAGAQAMLMELLVAPPATTPPEVERALVAAEDATYATLAGAGAWIYVLWLPLALFLAWTGIKNVDPLLGWVGFTVATAMAMLTARARGRLDAPTFFLGLVLSSTAIAIASRVFGTMILTPTLFTMNAVGFAAAARRAWLVPTILISVVALIAPAVLEAAGWLATTTTTADGAIHVTSAVVTFHEPQATVIALGAAALFLIMVTVAAGRIRARMMAQTRRAELASWQLRQLVPRIER
ncbi:MAG: serine/threonine protein kinase [Myxococcales bacterium]|nr:serine/threonine protein kinase [Myxococcales bacterium]